jgi:hypothetical protein
MPLYCAVCQRGNEVRSVRVSLASAEACIQTWKGSLARQRFLKDAKNCLLPILWDRFRGTAVSGLCKWKNS